MGYQITFAPTEEKMKELKKKTPTYTMPNDGYSDELSKELMAYCMKPRNEMTATVVRQIKTLLSLWYTTIKEDTRNDAYERYTSDKNHHLWYCGWEFARDSNWEKEDMLKTYADDFFVLAYLVDTPDFFEAEEKFYDKLSRVRENIDGFKDAVETQVIHEIIAELKPFELKDEDEDESKDEGITDDPCNSQFTGVYEEDLENNSASDPKSE